MHSFRPGGRAVQRDRLWNTAVAAHTKRHQVGLPSNPHVHHNALQPMLMSAAPAGVYVVARWEVSRSV